jgi:hypothetical protein
VSSIRESSEQEGGGFVRFDASHCLWYEVGDKVARDKVGQALRDSIRDNSNKRKNMFYATTTVAKQTEGKLPKHSTSTVTLESGLIRLYHEIAMDEKPFTQTKANCTEAWPAAQTDNILEWFENDMQ